MRPVRSTFVVLLVLMASRAFAQVSCADPDNLCTGNPCTITTMEVQSPCVVDFGARDLIIAGTLDVPDSGTLDFTAERILLQGRIDGRHVGNGVGGGASITLTATAGDAELRGGIDVTATAANGSITVSAAAGSILVKDTLNAKTSGANVTASGGVITLAAGGTIQTDQTAVLDAQGADFTPGGSIGVDGGSGVTIKGRTRAEGTPAGTISITSMGGSVTIEKDLRVESEQGDAGVVVVSGETGVLVDDKIRARGEGAGGDVTLTANNGSLAFTDKIRTSGSAGGPVTISAPNSTISEIGRIDARGLDTTGGAVTISGQIIVAREGIFAGGATSGGTVQLSTTGTLSLQGGKIVADGKGSGGSISLLGDPASGDVSIERTTLGVKGGTGAGGAITISAPAGSVTLTRASATLTGKNGLGGTAQIDGVAITVGAKTRFSARDGGEIRFDQSGPGLFVLEGSFDAEQGGTVEALAPAGSLTAIGKIVTDGGCIGLSAGGTLDTTQLATDGPITPTCP